VTIATLVLEYLKALIWPLVVAGVLIGYRRSAFRLLERLKNVDAAGVSATFDDAAEEAEEISTSATGQQPTALVPLSDATRFMPTSYREARAIGEAYRAGKYVLLDLNDINNDEAKRLVDFSAGMAFHGRGSMDKVTSRVFLLTPPTT
jgi:FtsZ-interacting cell division protein YlmF